MELNHPAVEYQLPITGDHYEFATPSESTHFYWGLLQAELKDAETRDSDTDGNHRAYRALEAAPDRIEWELTVNDEPVALLTDVFRDSGSCDLSWWRATVPPTLPATVTLRVSLSGDCSTVDNMPIAVYGTERTRLQWGETVTTTFELVPSDTPTDKFETRSDGLWNRHTVYIPQSKP